MVSRFILICIGLNLGCVPALAHQIGFGDQVLQPVTTFNALLPLLAVGLLFRQQANVSIDGAVVFMLGLGLIVGLSSKVFHCPSQSQLILAPGIAALAGSLVATARPVPEGALSFFILALGIAIGANLSFETTDWIDLSQSLLGAFAGALAVLYIMVTAAKPTTRDWHNIGLRIFGSWICACAIMALALEVRDLR